MLSALTNERTKETPNQNFLNLKSAFAPLEYPSSSGLLSCIPTEALTYPKCPTPTPSILLS